MRLGLVEFVQTNTLTAIKLTAFLCLLFAFLQVWTVTSFYFVALRLTKLAAFSPSVRADYTGKLWTRSMLALGESYWMQVIVVGGMLLLAAAYGTFAIGFSRLKKWARRPAMVLACVWFAAGVTFEWFFGIQPFSFVVELVFQGLLCWWTIWLLRRPEVKREFGIT